ncbi:hypothetical protein ASE05_10420 [Mesorhizobium sp. Root172]|nr:hypothetical protein ASE05_10420 [Mesorhizobium sp. Root172]
MLGILGSGGSAEIDAGHYSELDLMGFANSVKEGATLRIVNSVRLSALARTGLASTGKGRVMLA